MCTFHCSAFGCLAFYRAIEGAKTKQKNNNNKTLFRQLRTIFDPSIHSQDNANSQHTSWCLLFGAVKHFDVNQDIRDYY